MVCLRVEIASKELTRPFDGGVCGGRVSVNPLPFATRGIETVSCAVIELDLNVASVLSAFLNQRRAALVGNLLIGGAVENEDRGIRMERSLVELSFQAACRIKNERRSEIQSLPLAK